ncbi:reverse transcriptase family protein [Planctomicrobium sp. SH527]|uniref:reverse transcriptase family protein n=1 Tax=Planctomicrobium sp. SH527 TaxID=3448123 RepID=UPI003F5C57BD
MGLIDFVLRLLGISRRPAKGTLAPASVSDTKSPPVSTKPSAVEPFQSTLEAASPEPASTQVKTPKATAKKNYKNPTRLQALKYQSNLIPTEPHLEVTQGRPYRFAWVADHPGQFRNLSLDCDQRWLDYFGLPVLKTPDDLAKWLDVPIGKLAWLTHRTSRGNRAESEKQSHYSYRWLAKKGGGHRLIEAPKGDLKAVQEVILRELLDLIPAHTAAHGFVAGRSIITNAAPHIGQRLVMKFDLEDFYTNVRYSRVVAIFRSVGYSREVAIWLGRLTTSSIPWTLTTPLKSWEVAKFASRHLPQGAPTSPALANLSAFALDVRLQGLAEAYQLDYTRYADDLTFSGPGVVIPALNEIIPLVQSIIRSERFKPKLKKRRIMRRSSRQTVTGVVVNDKLNVARSEFDKLKATLHNCSKLGPSTQKREVECDFSSHLQGRIAHIRQLNPKRAEKLESVYKQIDWTK